jgi:hypothetical protein
LHIAKEMGAVVDRELVEAQWADHCVRFRNQMLAIPTRAAPLVINEDVTGAFNILTDLVHEALTELANVDDGDEAGDASAGEETTEAVEGDKDSELIVALE